MTIHLTNVIRCILGVSVLALAATLGLEYQAPAQDVTSVRAFVLLLTLLALGTFPIEQLIANAPDVHAPPR